MIYIDTDMDRNTDTDIDDIYLDSKAIDSYNVVKQDNLKDRPGKNVVI